LIKALLDSYQEKIFYLVFWVQLLEQLKKQATGMVKIEHFGSRCIVLIALTKHLPSRI
jgi:hypothetical protein